MDDRAEINISLQFEEFKFSFEKSKKVVSIKNDRNLKRQISQKLGLENISFKYEFHPNFQHNELIGDWIKKEKNPKVEVIIKSKSQSNSSQAIGILGLNFGSLDEIEKSRHESLVKQLKLIEEKHDLKLTEINKENQIKFRELTEKLDQLIGEQNLHPLIDFVSKFRLEILNQLVIEEKIPSSINNWKSMYDYLKEKNTRRELWSIIDEQAEKLGLDYEDWFKLRTLSNDINCFKHPNPILDKKVAYEKINSLKSTRYDNYQAPFKNLIDLFEKNNWS